MSEYQRYRYEGNSGPWEVVIGLEIHAQISSKSKLFSGARTDFGGEPNHQVTFIDAGFPGMLPVLNQFCVEQAIKTGLGLQAHINLVSVFDRKNYFYPDLPTGYQISQYHHPIVGQGYLEIEAEQGKPRRISITRLHLEQDAGKSIHDQHPKKTFIDLNRAGVALMEIVTEPDLHSPEEALAFIKKLRTLLRYLGTCDGNMEQGSLRADVNISLNRPGTPMGTRAEIKNINSIRFMGQAIHYEMERQSEILESGQTVPQETRLFDPSTGTTRSMRGKEDAHDYRYFPDPDLPPLVIEPETIERLKATLPELPDEKKQRYKEKFELGSYDCNLITAELPTALYYEEALASSSILQNKGIDSGHDDVKRVAKLIANWLTGEIFAGLNRDGVEITNIRIAPQHLAQLVDLLFEGVISSRIAKDIFAEMWLSGKKPKEIMDEKGLKQISDEGLIESIIEEILANNSEQVVQYQAGKEKVFGFFVGLVMKALKGQANPKAVNDLLKTKLLSYKK